MTELLTIAFARGQNESIDARLLPSDQHAVAKNVRWRKDGRAEKKYGVAAVPVTGLTQWGFNSQPVNAIAQWNNTPILAVGSTVRQLYANAWDSQLSIIVAQMSHFAPGEHNIISRDETAGVTAATSGYSSGKFVHVWSAGASVYYSVNGADGSVVVPPRPLGAGADPRCVSSTNYVYILSRNGTTIDLRVFDPATLIITSAASPGTLFGAAYKFDAQGRGSDFLLVYQSAAAVGTVKLISAGAVPVVTQTQTFVLVAAGAAQLGIGGTSASNVFAVSSDVNGNIVLACYNNAMTAALGANVIETDIDNSVQPGAVPDTSGTIAYLTWGGQRAVTGTAYTKCARGDSAGLIAFSTIGITYGTSPASKPFTGPAFATLANAIDGPYLWTRTSPTTSAWDTQQAYFLMQIAAEAGQPLRRHMHVPGAIPGLSGSGFQKALLDVLSLGVGSGYLTPLLVSQRPGNSPIFGFDTVTYRSIFESTRAAVRDVVTAGRALQFSGGSLFEFTGVAEETGFSNFPTLYSVVGGGGGGMAVGTYLYRAVYEWVDWQGRRHRSAPSDPLAFVNAASSSCTVTVTLLVADAHFPAASFVAGARGSVIHIYRTLAGQSTYHRVTPGSGAPAASIAGTQTVAFVDLRGDASISVEEVLYTDGGVADNTLAPPCEFMTVCMGRVWLAGQLDRCVITASKLLVDGEPTQFSDLEQFSVFLPQKCTGIASIDGTVVAFAADRIYFITGDGPNDQGVGSFNPPTELPTDVGCIDWRSVLETSQGVFFQGARGIYLLPRGFNTPVFVGAPVEASLAAMPYVLSSTLVTIQSSVTRLAETTARFVVGDDVNNPTTNGTAVLVYDMRTGGWSVDDTARSIVFGGTWNGAFITANTAAGTLKLFQESASAGSTFSGTTGGFVSTQLDTGDVRPFGVAGYGRFESVLLMGECKSACFVTVSVSVDDVINNYAFTLGAGDVGTSAVYLDVTPKDRIGTSIKVSCVDTGNPNANTPGEGFIMQALLIEHEAIPGTKRLQSARRL